ncbi:MAG TPA: hypothetical protein VN108_05875, partial [Marmoricola sp.]|nr:hypothetical protein [Marmoricola sp.]
SGPQVRRVSVVYMFFSLLVLLVGLVIAGLIGVYVSFPRRGHEVPRAAWLGHAMQRGVDALPTLDPEDTAALLEDRAEESPRSHEKSLASVE